MQLLPTLLQIGLDLHSDAERQAHTSLPSVRLGWWDKVLDEKVSPLPKAGPPFPDRAALRRETSVVWEPRLTSLTWTEKVSPLLFRVGTHVFLLSLDRDRLKKSSISLEANPLILLRKTSTVRLVLEEGGRREALSLASIPSPTPFKLRSRVEGRTSPLSIIAPICLVVAPAMSSHL